MAAALASSYTVARIFQNELGAGKRAKPLFFASAAPAPPHTIARRRRSQSRLKPYQTGLITKLMKYSNVTSTLFFEQNQVKVLKL